MKRKKHRAILEYYRTLDKLQTQQDVTHEGGLRRAFANLLSETAKAYKWVLVEEAPHRGKRGGSVRPDGTLRDQWKLPRGHWEAKDGDDDLDTEIRHKRDQGYPFTNIIFEDTQEAVLYQDESFVKRVSVRDKAGLAGLLSAFYSHKSAAFTSFDEAIARFQEEVPNIANGLKERIEQAHRENDQFQTTFAEFEELCRKSLNPNISKAAINEMLIQHLLTERIIRKVFDRDNFTRRNVIAVEVEKVIDSLTSAHFNRREFLGALDQFYTSIENAADRLAEYQEKQHFINTVYERFFQGYSVQVADTHGIVYTPQEIVEFMCAAVEQVLQDEFGQRLGNEGVVVIDPCTGTGNYALHLLRRAYAANPRDFERFYEEQLFANEVMLMPYYIASLNIEDEYRSLTQRYKAFEGLCFVDTLDLGKGKQLRFEFMSQKNTERIERQNKADINVVIGNPPYNVGQLNENDNNKNRTYELDIDIRNTYSKDSTATLRMQLYDSYVKFFRWATDALGNRDGIVCYVSNNSFIDGIAFDGMRKHLLEDFSLIYHLDLAGNIRGGKGQGGNIFDNQSSVGIGITVAVRSKEHQVHRLRYYRVADDMTGAAKRELLESFSQQKINILNNVNWQEVLPDKHHNWLQPGYAQEFAGFLSIGTRGVKATKSLAVGAIFKTYSNGVKTNRDAVVIDFDRNRLTDRIEEFVEAYNAEVDRHKRHGKPKDVDEFVNYEKIIWSSTLKSHLKRGKYAEFAKEKLRRYTYRPFSRRYLFFDNILVDRRLVFPIIFPTEGSEDSNRVICSTAVGNNKPFHTLMLDKLPDLHLTGDSQCFPLYTYDEEVENRRENITDWALTQFQTHYESHDIRKDDIFYYVYGLLHHPEYRERYADNLRKELPRIPYAPDFWAYSKSGRQLANLHLEYEDAEPYGLHWEINGAIDYRVEKMRPGEKSPSPNGDWKIFDTVKYNDTLTLSGIPPEAFDYRLGTRSALEWIIDQYQVTTERKSKIVRAPNEYSDDPRYIINLLEKVITVSVETVRIVNQLAKLEYR